MFVLVNHSGINFEDPEDTIYNVIGPFDTEEETERYRKVYRRLKNPSVLDIEEIEAPYPLFVEEADKLK